jgi:hypothetical protein
MKEMFLGSLVEYSRVEYQGELDFYGEDREKEKGENENDTL